VVSAFAIWSVVRGAGPFGMPTAHERLFALQLFMAVVAATGLLLAAAISERDASRAQGTRDLGNLRVSEERLRLALDAGRMGVWDWNVVTGEIRWSDNLEAIHGLAPGSFPGTFEGFLAIIHPEDRERVSRTIDQATQSGTGYDTEFRNVRADGSVGWISAKGLVVRDEAGRPVRMLGVGMDVTERRRLAEDLEAHARELAIADRRKDEFLAMLAHELRNPLAPISTALHLLRSEGRAGAAVLGILERQTKQLVRLVDDLLDVSRITQGKIALRKEPAALEEIVARALEVATPSLEARRHELRLALPAEPVELDVDPARLAQVIANLLDNASKYTPECGCITLEAERTGDLLELRVRDTGTGLAPEMLPHVFDLFVQGDRGLDRTHGGLGIGLTIVRRLVELHGGQVEARSTGPGHGSEFIVRLPGARSAPPPAALVPEPAAPRSDGGTTGIQVLIVEDNVDAAEALATAVGLWGHQVRVAHDAEAALALVEGWEPDVVVSDLGLPRMDGHELARTLRRRSTRHTALLIALSGYGRSEDRRVSLEAGFDHHLVKPPDLDQLGMLLDQVAGGLADRRAEAES
jgi:two-component system CheB/CheR fusion protein